MQNNSAEQIVTSFINNLLQVSEEQIACRQLMKNMPIFMMAETGKIIGENLVAVMPEADVKGLGLTQDELGKVPKLEKDTLMPKDLSQEKVRVQSPRCISPRSSCSSLKKSLKISKRSSMKLTEKLKSITANGNMSERKDRKNQTARFTKLQIENSEDEYQEEIQPMRERTQIRMKYLEDVQRLKRQKQKYFQHRLQQYNDTLDGNPANDMTYDYEGDYMRATVHHDKMKVNLMRTGMGMGSRKLKEGFSKINAETFHIEGKKPKEKGGDNSFYANKLLEMPLFPMKRAEPYNVKNLKLEEYKKHFGQKYSRMGMNQTQRVQRATTSRDDLFGEKKHLKERKQTVQAHVNHHERVPRRLALPKLHGTYKVLDRYEGN